MEREGILMNLPDPSFHRLLDAIAFAARAHKSQLRKDGVTPYHSHVFRVCLIVRHVFGVDDAAVLTAAVLHDTIEDTTTDFDDVEQHFGAEIAGWVALLSKDKRQRDDAREHTYCNGLHSAPWQVKICKLADIYDNLTDSAHLKPQQRPRTCQRSRVYLDALGSPNLPPAVQRAFQIVSELLSRMKEEG
jgi:guanosine-3',5'-bis(diphosphate) 3'-pyrophosphohydrolase